MTGGDDLIGWRNARGRHLLTHGAQVCVCLYAYAVCGVCVLSEASTLDNIATIQQQQPSQLSVVDSTLVEPEMFRHAPARPSISLIPFSKRIRTQSRSWMIYVQQTNRNTRIRYIHPRMHQLSQNQNFQIKNTILDARQIDLRLHASQIREE